MLNSLEDLVKHVHQQLFGRSAKRQEVTRDADFLMANTIDYENQVLKYYYKQCSEPEYRRLIMDRNGAWNRLNYIYNTLLGREVDRAGERAYLEKVQNREFKRVCKAIIYDQRHGAEFQSRVPEVKTKPFCTYVDVEFEHAVYVRGAYQGSQYWPVKKHRTIQAIWDQQALSEAMDENQNIKPLARGRVYTSYSFNDYSVRSGSCP